MEESPPLPEQKHNQQQPIPSAFKPVKNIEDFKIIEGNEEDSSENKEQKDHVDHNDIIDQNLKENITKLNINKTEKANVNTITNNTQNQPIQTQMSQKKKKKNKKKKWSEEIKTIAVEKALQLGVTHAIDLLSAEDSATYAQLSPSTLQYWVNQRTKKIEKKVEKKD